MDVVTLTTIDQDLNSLLDDRNNAEEIRVIMAEEPKIKVTDNQEMTIQMDRASESPGWRGRPAATAVREAERPLHPGPSMPLFTTSPYHDNLSDDEESPAAQTEAFQASSRLQ